MPITLPLGEWMPDMPDFNNPGMTVARNVVPLTPLSYGPLRSLTPFTGNRSINPIPALPAEPFGLYSFLDRNGNEHIFTGTKTKLYQFKTGDTEFQDVSEGGVTYSATPFSPWVMVGFGNSVIAVNGSDSPLALNIDTDTEFSPLDKHRAPFAKYACVCRDFLILANVTECADGVNYPQRIHWCAIGDASLWPDLGSPDAAQLQSDAQDLRSDLGHIRGIASNLQGADLIILMDEGVYTGRYVGSPAIFDFQIAQGAVGCRVPRSVVVNNGICYYLGSTGFIAFDGNTPGSIGANKIDKWFFSDPDDGVDPNYLYLTQGSSDPTGRLIMWAYCGPDSGGVPNRLLIYNWQLNRWSMARINIAWLGQGLSTGYSLDQLDEFGTMETLTPGLDDPFWQGGVPYLLAFSDEFQVMAFTGPALAATIETLEGDPTASIDGQKGKRSRVTSARPLVDGGTPSVAVGARNRLEDAPVYSDPVAMNVYGSCPLRADARYLRGRITIPAATVWTHIQGIDVDFAVSTYR